MKTILLWREGTSIEITIKSEHSTSCYHFPLITHRQMREKEQSYIDSFTGIVDMSSFKDKDGLSSPPDLYYINGKKYLDAIKWLEAL